MMRCEEGMAAAVRVVVVLDRVSKSLFLVAATGRFQRQKKESWVKICEVCDKRRRPWGWAEGVVEGGRESSAEYFDMCFSIDVERIPPPLLPSLKRRASSLGRARSAASIAEYRSTRKPSGSTTPPTQAGNGPKFRS